MDSVKSVSIPEGVAILAEGSSELISDPLLEIEARGVRCGTVKVTRGPRRGLRLIGGRNFKVSILKNKIKKHSQSHRKMIAMETQINNEKN